MMLGLDIEGATHEAHVARLDEYETSSQAPDASALPAVATDTPPFLVL